MSINTPREYICVFLDVSKFFFLPGKTEIFISFGVFYSKRRRMNEALKCYESALEHVIKVYEEPVEDRASILHNLGFISNQQNQKTKSLRNTIQKAKEVMYKIQRPDLIIDKTLETIRFVGTNFYFLGQFDEAYQCLKDALEMKNKIYGENGNADEGERIFTFLGMTAQGLGKFTEAKKYLTKAVKIGKEKISSTKNTCSPLVPFLVENLVCLGEICEGLNEPVEELKHLEEARKIVKNAGFMDWPSFGVLITLIKKYAVMGSIEKCLMCYIEAGGMAKNLPKVDCLPLEMLEMLKLMNI